jgi:hypothetical protein
LFWRQSPEVAELRLALLAALAGKSVAPLEMRGVAEKQVCGISALVHAALLNSPGAGGGPLGSN